MAERRMFAKTIIDSDMFLDMPLSSQALYFHLSMRADDDGFISNPKRIQRMVSCSDDDLKLLVAKNFIIPFESGVVVIKHWKIHNYIKKDRYKETIYRDEKGMLTTTQNNIYEIDISNGYQVDTECIQNGHQVDTQDRLGKDSIVEDRLEIENTTSKVAPVQPQTILDMFNEICKSYPRATKLSESRRKAIKARLKMYSIDDFKQLFEMAEGSSFLKGGNNHNWSANFDWLIKDANMAKVLDGNYSDAGEKQQEEPERRKKEPVSEGFRAIYERNMRRKEMEERGEIPEEPFDPTRLPFQ